MDKYKQLATYILWWQVGFPEKEYFESVTGLTIQEPSEIVTQIKNNSARVMLHHNPWYHYLTKQMEPTTKEILDYYESLNEE